MSFVMAILCYDSGKLVIKVEICTKIVKNNKSVKFTIWNEIWNPPPPATIVIKVISYINVFYFIICCNFLKTIPTPKTPQNHKSSYNPGTPMQYNILRDPTIHFYVPKTLKGYLISALSKTNVCSPKCE